MKTIKNKNQNRQGDVWIERINSIPKSAVKQTAERIILAHGEATGHHHSIADRDAADWWKDGADQFVEVHSTTEVVHQEHSAITLAPGKYRVIRQREYSPEAIRNVAD